jgi:predicted DNA-binding transcriptional regulator
MMRWHKFWRFGFGGPWFGFYFGPKPWSFPGRREYLKMLEEYKKELEEELREVEKEIENLRED